MAAMISYIHCLFPVYEYVSFVCGYVGEFTDFIVQELQISSENLKEHKAHGPTNIPPEKFRALHKRIPTKRQN